MHGLTALGLLGFTASAGALDLTPNEPARDLAPHLSYVRADDLSLDSVAAVAALPQSAFAPLPGGQMDFGVLSGTVWLALDIANRGAEPSRWRLVTDLLWADLVIYQERHGALVPLLRTAQSDDFADRPIDYRFLAADFELDDGEVSRLLIPRGSLKRAGMTLTIETAATFAAERRRDDAATAAVYAALVFAILFAALQYAVQREGVQLAYLGFTTSATLALAQDEGNLGQHLPSDWAMTGYYATLVALTVFTVQFARTFLRTSEITPRIDRVLLCLPAATLVTVAGSWLRVPFFVVVQNFPLLAAVLLSFGTGLYAYLRGRPTVRSDRIVLAAAVALLDAHQATTAARLHRSLEPA